MNTGVDLAVRFGRRVERALRRDARIVPLMARIARSIRAGKDRRRVIAAHKGRVPRAILEEAVSLATFDAWTRPERRAARPAKHLRHGN